MTILQIPYAFTANGIIPVLPKTAEKGQRFVCPTCREDVILRRGHIRRSHFAHKPETGCSGEGVVHRTVKQMIYLMYKRSMGIPSFHGVRICRSCPNCGRQGSYSIRSNNYDVKREAEFGGFRVDIALYQLGKLFDPLGKRMFKSKPIVGIEIRDTHPVSDEKWDAFAELGFPCIEVTCDSVIKMWEWDLNGWRPHIPKMSIPMNLYLKPVKHNLHLFGDRIHRINCPDCDKIY